ncbi:MAG: FtsQ-type POTRA domain-containing protein [Oscillatoriales cyanobacterium SM2_1_8]|nr:FtsQ-type POTRA domain-containing protein [Oscillatoriales cyanobacterium SM2_1_8]
MDARPSGIELDPLVPESLPLNSLAMNPWAMDYGARRRQRRQQQRHRALVGFWRLCALGGLISGAYWLADRPEWMLHNAQQIEVRGNQAIPTPIVQNALGVTSPRPIFRVDPKTLTQQVQALAPVRSASVQRQLFPAKLVVEVAERQPVARFQYQGQQGAIDAEGIWLDPKIYRTRQQPQLTLLADATFARQDWPQLYDRLQRSPVILAQVDARDPADLRVTLPSGAIVRCGPFQPERLEHQLQKLDSLRHFPALAQKGAILDLVDPTRPLLVTAPQPSS